MLRHMHLCCCAAQVAAVVTVAASLQVVAALVSDSIEVGWEGALFGSASMPCSSVGTFHSHPANLHFDPLHSSTRSCEAAMATPIPNLSLT